MDSLILIADVAQGSSDSGLFGGLIGAAGGIGFVMWYGYHMTTSVIPSIVSDFREERKLDREEREAERKEFSGAIGRLSDAVNSLPCRVEKA